MIQSKSVKLFLFIASVLCTLFVFEFDVDGLSYLFLLPLVFGVCVKTCIPEKMLLNPGLLIFLLVSTFRYLLYPITLVNSYTPIPNVNIYGDEAIFFMCLEIIVIFITINMVFKNEKPFFLFLKNTSSNSYVLIILILLCLPLILTGNDFFLGKHFIWETSAIQSEYVKINGVASQVFSWTQSFFVIVLLGVFSNKYFKYQRNYYYWFAIIICFFPCIFYEGHSRLSLLIPLVCSSALAYKIFGNKSKLAISVSLLAGSVVLTILSIVKNLNGSYSAHESEGLFSSTLLNAYFQGVENIVVGLSAFDKFGINTSWFLWDSFKNAMGISSFFTTLPGSSTAFNDIYYWGTNIEAYDQIVPTIIQGMFYFGKFLCFIPTIMMTYVVCKCDIKFSNVNSLELAFLYSNFPVIVAWAIPGSWMHLTARFFNFYVPILLLIYLNNRRNRKIFF